MISVTNESCYQYVLILRIRMLKMQLFFFTSYEKSDTHRFEVPRMLFDEPEALEHYISMHKDKLVYTVIENMIVFHSLLFLHVKLFCWHMYWRRLFTGRYNVCWFKCKIFVTKAQKVELLAFHDKLRLLLTRGKK